MKCKWWSLLYPKILASSDLQFWGYCDFYILAFWLETAYSHPPLRRFWGIFCPNDVIYRFIPKGTSLRRNTSFEPSSVKLGPTVRTGRVPEKKGQDMTDTKVTKALYFTYLG